MENSNKYKIDISNWKRRDHYNFFKGFQQPFFGITNMINCTEAYAYCKAHGVNFFLYYLHKSLIAVNQIKEFRYRMEGEEVFEYAIISGSVTVMRRNETFGFAYFNYQPNFESFSTTARLAIDHEKTNNGLQLRADLTSLIHYSVLPRVNFTSMQHAQHIASTDSIPKIVFGKLSFEGTQVLLPVAVHVHHALCDGIHVSNFFDAFNRQMQIT
ncbi:CatA-like O-acetyltransferase [Sphingobacterium sp. MYb382]|uniref:CatA-like O-acetyltransferase n=1 Tax=Sphingobacterium sp. MYb382 TaxID=2745278 RepID=UPI0030A1FCC6